MPKERFQRLLSIGLKYDSKILFDTGDILIVRTRNTKIAITKKEYEEFKFECEILADK
ncbi:MAG: hypothetical protein LBF97_01790 [Elusimicrobiota bacterium]|jgi:Fe2+ transport system protein FeoA|nr:hypothetical protein [Elusimicrobiota bacterium]